MTDDLLLVTLIGTRDPHCEVSVALPHLFDKLKAVKEPDGSSLFDNTCIAYGSNIRHLHYTDNIPTFVAGGGSGFRLAERSREQGRLNLASLKTCVGAAGTAKLKVWKESRFPEMTTRERRLIEIEIEILQAEKAVATNASLATDVQLAIDAARKLLTNYEPPLVEGRFWQIKFHGIGGNKSELGLIKRAKDIGREKLVPELDGRLAFWTTERERWSERSLLAGYAATDPAVAELVAARQRIAQIDEQLPISNLSYLFEPLKSGYIHVRCDGGLRRDEDLIPVRDLQKTAGVQINSNYPDRAWLEPFTGRVAGDKWAKSDGEINGGERSVSAGGLPPSLQAQLIRNLDKPVNHLQSPQSAAEQQRWLAELERFNALYAARHATTPDLAARTASFREAYLMQSAAPEAFDLTRELADRRMRELYGLDPQPTRSTGTKLLLARRLVERGVRFIVVTSMSVSGTGAVSGDWDTHTPSQLLRLVPSLARACDQPLERSRYVCHGLC